MFISYPLDFEQLWNASQLVEVEGVPIRVASIDDLIQLKQAVARPQDLIDVEQLARLRKANHGN